MTDQVTESGVELVEGDLSCAICSYNLKGQPKSGLCPECGRAVERTLNQELTLADPAWLRFQARSMLWLIAVCLLNYRPTVLRYQYEPVYLILELAMAVIVVYACWCLARPEGHEPPPDSLGAQQRGLKVVAVVVAVWVALQTVASISPEFMFQNAKVLGLLGLIGTGALIVLNWLVGILLYKLARRSKNQSMIAHAKLVLWALPISQLAQFAISLGVGLASDSRQVQLAAYSLMGWGMGIVFYGTVALLGRMHEMLAATANSAQNLIPPASRFIEPTAPAPAASLPLQSPGQQLDHPL